MLKKLIISAILCIASLSAFAAAQNYTLSSPDGKLTVKVSTASGICYSVEKNGIQIINPSEVSMTLSDGTVYGGKAKLLKASKKSVDQTIKPAVYKKAEIEDKYNELTLSYKAFNVVFRAYNDGAAYRFVSKSATAFTVQNEQASFNFAQDWQVYVPYVRDFKGDIESQFKNSFENTYSHHALSAWEKNRLAFLPLTVEAANGMKVCITESDLLDYPGMYLLNNDGTSTLKGVYAPYPKDIDQGGHNMLQGIVKTRENYIAKAQAGASFPWRTIIVADQDKDLLNSDMVYKLGTPAQDTDWSWIKPGKVAWDWWNDWNIYGVDFRAGINNDTYKYYIDFASKHGIEYVILDEGWAVNLKADLFQVIPEINLEELVAYASSRNVGLILWAGYWAVNRDIEGVCKHFAEMGIKGFKVDFMDRDDQAMVEFFTKTAQVAAKYHLMLDFHGAFKPAGLHRTYPNVINYEGVHGLEQMKWSDASVDQVTYDVTIPFTRMVAGPFDYTQGAMKNATKRNYHPVNTEPMSQGTRCRQLAEYVIFEAPFTMLCDSPSNYMAEPECTDFIASIPTVWDETVAVDGKIAEYVSIARRSGDTWYVGAMTNWSARDLTLDLSFLPEGNWSMEIYQDGINADRAACDYAVTREELGTAKKVKLHMAPGGGWIAKISKK